MNQYNVSLTSTLSSLFIITNQSLNRTSSVSSISKNTYMRYAQVVYVATLVILGVFGNTICAIVFLTKSLRRIRSSAYLFTLALIDVFFLLDLLPGMIHTAFVTDLYHKVNFICHVQIYISFVASFVHIWMVLGFTAERFFAVNFPLKHMSQCTPNLSRGVIFIIIIPALICYIHPAFFVSEVDDKGQCREKDGYERYLTNLNIIDTIMTMFLPFILVSILNVLIINKLFCSKTFRQHVFANGSRYQCRRTSNWSFKTNSTPQPQQQQPTSSSASTPTLQQISPLLYRSQRLIRPFHPAATQSESSLYRTFTNSESTQTNLNNTNIQLNETQQQQQQSTITTSSSIRTKQTPVSRRNESAQRHVLTELRLTKMLLAISLTCLSLNFPSYYLRFMFLYKQSKEDSSTDTTHSNEIDFAFYRDVIFHYMSYLSYSINIVIYLLFGGNFRRALKRLFSLTSKRSEYSNSTLRGFNSLYNEKQYGNMNDYDSVGLTTVTPNSSLRSNFKSFKLHEQASLNRTLRQQQIFISQQNKT
ncbi:unnamed protein product [Adineta steineri]|uniref:G-protein coupled receptors family 1 profile domain-containing protein n=1 Tax=Adineta steineri TaxID=433720 RepID=A0A814YGK1_9BILA|nr:unnamed protein product [Adineta steineri]CAF1511648.1 unnamed protein product [Adineta steineri]